jgi:hypothetical protein
MRRADKKRILTERLRMATQRHDDLRHLHNDLVQKPTRQGGPPPPGHDPGILENAYGFQQLRHECEFFERLGDEMAEKVGELLISKSSDEVLR